MRDAVQAVFVDGVAHARHRHSFLDRRSVSFDVLWVVERGRSRGGRRERDEFDGTRRSVRRSAADSGSIECVGWSNYQTSSNSDELAVHGIVCRDDIGMRG